MVVGAAKPRLNDNFGIGRKDRKMAGRQMHKAKLSGDKEKHTHSPTSPGAHKHRMDDEEMDGADGEKDEDELNGDERNLEGPARFTEGKRRDRKESTLK